MASYDYEPRERTRRYVREERREERDDPYLKVYPSRELVPRGREDSDLSVEEIRRDFPPPGYPRDIRRARSAEPEYPYDDDWDRRSHDPRDRARGHRKGPDSVYYEEEEKSRKRMLSKQEKIVAAVAGAALAFGGKEIYDRRGAKEHGGEVQRNYLTSAGLAAAGALAGYQGAGFYNKHASKEEKKSHYIAHRGRDGKVSEYYSDDEDEKGKKGHKSFLENALAASGLGVAVKALTGGGGKDDKSDTRSRRGSPDSRSSRSKSRTRGEGGPANKVQKAAMASLIAGATEAFRVAKEPGGWKGEKTKRILTAAAGAAAIDTAQDSEKHGKLGLAESVIGGLIGNRVINGSKSNIEEDRKTGRSRSRSRARSEGGGGVSGLAALATAGLGALGAKKAIDHARSRSRGRDDDSDDSRGGARHRSRSRSVVDSARKKLAKFGIGSDPDDKDRDRSRSRSRARRDDSYQDDSRGARRGHRRYSDDSYDDDDRRGGTRGGRSDYDDDRSHSGRQRDRPRRRGGRSDAGSESDLGDSSEDERRAKKIRGKQVITTGLAAVATIHAAHGVYQSMEKREARRKAVKEGRLSPEEAKKLKTKALLQDAASVGIAALGIKGAVSELKEAKEKTHEFKEWKEEKERRHQRRIERQKKIEGVNGRSRADNWAASAPPRSDRQDYGPQYYDGNPYSTAALPAPPVGYDYDR